jgi:hypothetical protein
MWPKTGRASKNIASKKALKISKAAQIFRPPWGAKYKFWNLKNRTKKPSGLKNHLPEAGPF